ncbi:MAG: serine/threonine-protein kinase [Gemmatimonadota bacterium]
MRQLPTKRWAEVERVLDAALQLPSDEVPAYLERECGEDADLRREVEQLLQSCAKASGFLEELPGHLAAELLAERSAPTGRRIGPYVVSGEIGRGGMGVVYLAERNDGQFKQRVALKVLPHGLESDHAIRRFLEERQILASLVHPGIARLLDGGVTDDELPYFAMEYVDGTSIDKYCDKRQLSIEERLRLFAEVCDAVQYAHQNLVVHRDLKPSNIFVTEDGSVRLLDFGIAKLVSSDVPNEAAEAQDITGTAGRWLTPRYASPEQMCGKPITTVSDVYTLGVLLYELLTGHSPYHLAALTPAELSRAVCEQEAPRPSVAVLRHFTITRSDGSTVDIAPEDAARARGLRPDRLARRLQGDLDTIVLTAMRKDTARRYASAGVLADDVRRHLAGRPVRARPDTLTYRASRFVRRHRVAVSVGGALVLSLIIGGAGIAWQGTIAQREREYAQRQAATAARASALLVEMFRLSDPDVSKGETITAREILTRVTRRVETDFARDPDLQALMLLETGRIYQNLTLLDDAERLVRQGVALRRGDGPSLDLAAGLHQLGEIEASRARFAEAESHFREAFEMRRALHREPHDDITASARGLADVLHNQRKHDGAEPLYHEVIAAERRLHGPDSPHVASALYALAVNNHDRGKFGDAEPLFRAAVTIYRRIPGTNDPVAASARFNLANVLLFTQRYAEAEPLFREALQLRRQMYPPGHRATIEALAGLGSFLHNTSQFKDAEAVIREGLETGSATLGADHPDILQLKQILGAVQSELARYADADRWLSDVLQHWRKRDEPNNSLAFTIHIIRGESRLLGGRLDAAQADFREALVSARRVFGSTHPLVALGMRGMARVEMERGQMDEAIGGLRRAVASFGPAMRPNHHYVLGTKRLLAEALTLRGRYAEADSLLTDVLALQRKTMVPGHVEIGRVLQAHGEVKRLMGDPRGAEQLLREALMVRTAALGTEHWSVAETESSLGAALAAQQRHDEARPLLASAYERLLAQRGSGDRRTREAFARFKG